MLAAKRTQVDRDIALILLDTKDVLARIPILPPHENFIGHIPPQKVRISGIKTGKMGILTQESGNVIQMYSLKYQIMLTFKM